MAETADAENRDQIAWARAAVPQRVVGRHAGAEKRRGVHRSKLVGDRRERLLRRHHVLGITTIIGDAWRLQIAAGHEIAAAAALAPAAMTAMPADADSLTDLPRRHVRAERIDDSRDLVARHDRVADAGEGPFLGEGIAVADSAGLDPDAHLAPARLWNVALDQLERPVWV